jgi:GNAT superfamily N-acetyltransferase
LQIIHAISSDANLLTKLCFASKRVWGYPEDYFKIWQEELTITPEKIQNQPIFKAIYENSLVGMYSLIEWQQNYYLEHIFIDPNWLHHGFGTLLFNHAKQIAQSLGYHTLDILVDPNARGFYDKQHAICIEEIPSNIPGRLIPHYRVYL